MCVRIFFVGASEQAVETANPQVIRVAKGNRADDKQTDASSSSSSVRRPAGTQQTKREKRAKESDGLQGSA